MKIPNLPKNTLEDGQRRLAVLIDADNAQASIIEGLLAEIARYGIASVKRIYGDWTSTHTAQWKKSLLKHSINPVQQFPYTTGKNATDSAMIIDAMDLMYTGRFDGFCIISSDSDFTRLAQRLREEGLMVFGFGEKKTPESFVAACDKFVYTEVLRPDASSKINAAVSSTALKPSKKANVPKAKITEPEPASSADSSLPIELIRQAIEEESDENGWAHLGAVGSYLTKIRPDFDSRLYGFKKLSELFKKSKKYFAVEERNLPGVAS
ncbi:MAG: NYN domain-containing protein, partial [Arenimonas sp.]|nr:NYN domain-containing protein [Arenimonas sp.]